MPNTQRIVVKRFLHSKSERVVRFWKIFVKICRRKLSATRMTIPDDRVIVVRRFFSISIVEVIFLRWKISSHAATLCLKLNAGPLKQKNLGLEQAKNFHVVEKRSTSILRPSKREKRKLRMKTTRNLMFFFPIFSFDPTLERDKFDRQRADSLNSSEDQRSSIIQQDSSEIVRTSQADDSDEGLVRKKLCLSQNWRQFRSTRKFFKIYSFLSLTNSG